MLIFLHMYVRTSVYLWRKNNQSINLPIDLGVLFGNRLLSARFDLNVGLFVDGGTTYGNGTC